MVKQRLFLFLVLIISQLLANGQPYLLVLGTAQDGGYPQAGCYKACCKAVYNGTEQAKHVTCMALVDPASHQSWLFEATPDFAAQLHLLREHLHDSTHLPSGIFITHAHIGHYSGLMQLGKEVMGTKNIPVYAMPRFSEFLKTNGPWSQLLAQQNIELRALTNETPVTLANGISVKPIQVPHRDEYSETVGFDINFGNKTALFIPDIDKWEKWDYLKKAEITLGTADTTERRLVQIFARYDYVLIDATFYKNGELPGRDMSQIPHPFVEETMKKLIALLPEQRKKIYFIHFNHTNPLLRKSAARKEIEAAGFSLGEELMVLR